jgi:hypothetical protein
MSDEMIFTRSIIAKADRTKYNLGIQDFSMMPVKIYKHYIAPNDLKFDHWRTPLDINIEWKSQDFHNALYKSEPYKYARHIPIEKDKILPLKEDTSLKSSPSLTLKNEISLDETKTSSKIDENKHVMSSLSDNNNTNDEKVEENNEPIDLFILQEHTYIITYKTTIN